MKMVAGVDEAGRGPLAGPVVAAAVILRNPIAGLKDSKKISEANRLKLYSIIKKDAYAWSVGIASVEEIDHINILQATLLAMRRAIIALPGAIQMVYVDGNQAPLCDYPVETIIGGDDSMPCISAASIIAKVTRDQMMILLDKQYPGYGFAQHKGYGTEQHVKALDKLGACAIHRRSFAPVQRVIAVEVV